jgi:RecB family exonuclease
MEFRDLENRFMYHPPKKDQGNRYEQIREAALRFATVVNELTPDSREKSLAITNLEEAVMWANASIARNEP